MDATHEEPERRDLPPGIEYRGTHLWVRYGVNGRKFREPCPAHVTSPRAAARWRAERIAQQTGGSGGSSRLKAQVAMDAVIARYERDGRRSLDSARGRAKAVSKAFGHVRIVDLTPEMVDAASARWVGEGLTPAAINRRLKLLRRGLRLLVEGRQLAYAPHVPLLLEKSPEGRYMTPADLAAIVEELPPHLRGFVAFAYAVGVRKRQLARTLRRFVDVEAATIAWPTSETKTETEHVVPLEEGADGTLAIVEAAMAEAVPHCPFLFHSPDCRPGRTPSKRFGCIGDFKKAWATACKKAGFPVGRKHGGFVFHHTRNSAASNLRRAGVEEADAMKITGHLTPSVFRRYAIEDAAAVEARRAALAKRAAYVASLGTTRKVVPMRRAGGAA